MPLARARWHGTGGRWGTGARESLGFECSRAAGANVKAASDRRGDGKWSDSRARTYWTDRPDGRVHVRAAVALHASATDAHVGHQRPVRVLDVGRMKGHRDCTRDPPSNTPIRPWRNFEAATSITSHCSRCRIDSLIFAMSHGQTYKDRSVIYLTKKIIWSYVIAFSILKSHFADCECAFCRYHLRLYLSGWITSVRLISADWIFYSTSRLKCRVQLKIYECFKADRVLYSEQWILWEEKSEKLLVTSRREI